MKKLLSLILALCMVLSLAAFAGAGAEGAKEITYSLYSQPDGIDPGITNNSFASYVLANAFEGLMTYDTVTGSLTCGEAESYTVSEDGLVYTFTLRDGLKWSDGSDHTAADYVYAIKRILDPATGAQYVDLVASYIAGAADYYAGAITDFDSVGIKALDDRTLEITLVNATSYFADILTMWTFSPVQEATIAANGDAWTASPATYVCNGPFLVSDMKLGESITLEKNPYYWNADAVKLSGLNFYLSEDNTAILTAYENNTVQYIQSISSTEYDRLNATYPGELEFYPTQGTYYILFNVYKDLSPASKQLTVQEQSKARFALGQMINRYEVVNYITKGGEVAATGFFPVGLADGLNSDVRAVDYYGTWYANTNEYSEINPDLTVDQVEALQTLIDLGYPYTGTIEGGDITFTDFPSIEFAFNNSGNNALIIQYIQEIWNRFGITGTVNQEAWATLQSKLKAGDAEAARMGWVADFNDVVNFLEIFISASGNNYPRLGREIGFG